MPRRTSKPQPNGTAFDAAVRLLARRPHSRVELRRKLARRGFDENDLDAALRRLAELGYVNDATFAEGHVRRRSAGLGPLALSAELAARGVDKAVAAAALTRFAPEAQLAAATRLAERLCASKQPAGYRELLNSVGAKLLRRGFSASVARAACAAAWSRTVAGPEL